jgi:hypothetical protein
MLTLTLGAASFGLVACGGGFTSTNAAATRAQGPAQGPFAAARDPKVAACLKQHGVTVPNRRAGGGRFGGRRPPSTTPTTPRRPPGGLPGGNAARFQKLRAALAACGVNVPGPGGAGSPVITATTATPS